MEAVGHAARVITEVEIVNEAFEKIPRIIGGGYLQELPEITGPLRRLQYQYMLFKAVAIEFSDNLHNLSENVVDIFVGGILKLIKEKLDAVAKTLSRQDFKKPEPGIRFRQLPIIEAKLNTAMDLISEDVRFLRDYYQTFTSRDFRRELDKIKGLPQEVAPFRMDSPQVKFDKIDHQLAVLHTNFARAFDLSNNPDQEDETSNQRREALEEVRQTLYERLGSLNQPSLVFPFNLVSQGSNTSDELRTRRVKLDTGAHENWIHSSVLERWGVQYDPMDDPKTYVGAGGGLFRSLGSVTLFWYSINKAKTKEGVFLVHDNLPFDAILGSGFIMAEPMDTFAEGVLPLMHIIPKDELGRLQDTMTARGASSEEVKKIQRARKAQERDESRQLKAASRAATRIGTPGLATPTGGLLYPTMSRAGTSTTTLLSSTLLSGSTPQRSGISTPAATADP